MLRDERERVKNELAADRAEQESLSKKLGVAAVGPTTPDPYDNEIARLRDELVKARTAHDEAAARLISMDATQPVSSAALSAEADELTATDPGLLSIRTPLNQQRAALIAQMADLSPNHPQYKQDAQKLKEIDASLAAMQNDMRSSLSARIRQRLRTDLNRTGDVEGRLNAQLGQLTGAAVNATPKLQRANDLTADIARLQGRFAIVDERFHDLTIENSAPGAAHIWAAATPPLHPSVIGILRIAALIAFAGAILALVAALLANFLDPRVYIGADIEQALGFSPMAQIPDFTEVSDGVAEEHLLRLAAALDHGFQQGTLKKCLFTGTAPGTGVTAVVTRIGAMIEAMGAPTVLVDLSGAGSVPAHAGSAGSDLYDALDTRSTHRGGRSTALLQQLSDVPESEQGLVLIDAAPLPISAETEYLARYVDATIVVVESGVTTRAQVRAAANTLQRLEVAAMGFVLNRIRLEKADPGFRQSISATERHLRTQSRSFPRLTARSRPPAPAPPPPTDQASHADNPGPPVPQAVPARNTFVAEDSVRPHGPVDPALPEALPFQPHVSSVPRGATRIQPVSLTESPASGMEPAGPKQEAPHAPASNPAKPLETLRTSERQDVAPAVSGPHPESRDSQPASTSFPAYVTDWLENVKPRPAQEEVRGPAENTYDAATRLGGLRDLIFPDGPKNEQRAAEAPRQEPVVAHRIDPIHEPPAHAHSSLPAWQTPARKEVLNTAPPRMTAPPEILPPLPLDDAADRELSRGNVTKMRRRDYRDPDDDMGILPASRGQYTRRK